jgi:hypothetical protein
MTNPLLYAGVAAAGYLAGRERSGGRASTAGPPISGKHALALGGSHADNYTLYRSEAFGSPYSILGGHTYRTGSRPGIQATIRLSRQGRWQWLIEEVGEGHHAVAHLVKHGSEESFHAAAAAIERAMKKLGRSARGRRGRKSAYERNVEGVRESDADHLARIRASLNWISFRDYPYRGASQYTLQYSADIPGGHVSYGKFGDKTTAWMHRNKKDYALVKSRDGYKFERVTTYPAYGFPYHGSATFRTGSDARKALSAALAANPRVGTAARGRS